MVLISLLVVTIFGDLTSVAACPDLPSFIEKSSCETIPAENSYLYLNYRLAFAKKGDKVVFCPFNVIKNRRDPPIIIKNDIKKLLAQKGTVA